MQYRKEFDKWFKVIEKGYISMGFQSGWEACEKELIPKISKYEYKNFRSLELLKKIDLCEVCGWNKDEIEEIKGLISLLEEE